MKRFRELIRVLIEIIFEDGKSILMPLFTIFTAIIIFFIINKTIFKEEMLSDKTDTIKLVLLVSVMAVSVLPILIKFLYTDKEKKADEFTSFTKIREEIQREKIIQQQLKDVLLKNTDLINVEKSVYEKVISNLEGSLINKLGERFKTSIENEFISNSITAELQPLTRNTEKYIDRIQRNSIVNLIIGIIGTITAISILAFSILSDKTFIDMSSFLIHFLPRVTFVVFIQLFAFFFLRLYKNNLEDAKYFQNELTNLAAKSSALRIAFITKNDEKVSEIIKDLSNTERNFKLLKDESLLNLEKAKLEKDFDLEALNAFKDFLKTYKKE